MKTTWRGFQSIYTEDNVKRKNKLKTNIEVMKYIRLLLIVTFFVNISASIGQNRGIGHAASNGNLKRVKELVEKGADVNSMAYGDWTPLVVAIKYDKIHVITYLIENGADVNLECENKWTPLTLASKKKQRRIVQLLMKNGAEPDKVNGFDRSAMFYAVKKGDNQDIINLLKDSKKNTATSGKREEIDFSLFNTQELKEMYKEAIFKKDDETIKLIKEVLKNRIKNEH